MYCINVKTMLPLFFIFYSKSSFPQPHQLPSFQCHARLIKSFPKFQQNKTTQVTHWEFGKSWSPCVTAPPSKYLVIIVGQGHAYDGCKAAFGKGQFEQKEHTTPWPSCRGSHLHTSIHPVAGSSSQTAVLVLKLSSHNFIYWLDTKAAVPQHYLGQGTWVHVVV